MQNYYKIIFLIVAFGLMNCDKREFNNPVTSGQTLATPGYLRATQAGEWIKLEWETQDDVTSGWVIERKICSSTFAEIAHLDNAAILTFTDTTITTEVAYEYRIKGYSDENKTPYSEQKAFYAQFPVPTGLSATPLNDAVIQLTWKDNCTFEEGFIVQRKSGQSNYADIKSVGANVTTLNDSGLIFGTDYQYRIKAFTNKNQSGFSNVFTNSTIFPAPTNLQANSESDTEIQLIWTDNCSFETGYLLERKTESTSFQQIAELTANATEYKDTGLQLGTNYIYRVRAYTTLNVSDFSNELIASPNTIAAPSNLAAKALNDEQIKLIWSDNCGFETGFTIVRSEDGINYLQVGQVESNITTFTDSQLFFGPTYYYRVNTYTSSNSSDYSNTITQKTIFPKPSNLSATPQTDTQIMLTWTDNCDFEAGFKIERSDDGTNFTLIDSVQSNIITFTDKNLSFGPTYYYRVFAYTVSNNSAYSNSANSTTTFPGPSNLLATPQTDTEIQLNWADNCGFESGFKIERSDDGTNFTLIDSVQSNITTFTDVNLSLGYTYYYRVFAFTTSNKSHYSNNANSATTFSAPSDLIATPQTDTEIQLTWTDNCDFEAGYRVERSSDGSAFTQVGEVGANATTYTDNSALWDTAQKYRVYAFTTANNSDYSNETTMNPSIVAAPTDLQFTQTSITDIQLSWQDNCDFEDGFRLERSDDGGAWTQISELAANTTEFTDTGLDYTITYAYRIKAWVGTKETAWSNEVSGKPCQPLLDMILVNGGTFTMGDTWGDGESNELPTHSVTISLYYFGQYEVTNAQAAEVYNWALGQGLITAGSSTVQNASGDAQELLDLDDADCQISYNGSQLLVDSGKENYPVIEITWYGAAAFCNYLSQKEGFTPVYNLSDWSADWSADGYRLPTEAEWEYAAKGGASGTYTKYSGSDVVDEVAWYSDNSGGQTHTVGAKQANELIIYDMSGNAWEWCNDWYGSYGSAAQTNPTGPSSGGNRVLRGGSWYYNAYYVRVASRYNGDPYRSSDYYGFRITRTY